MLAAKIERREGGREGEREGRREGGRDGGRERGRGDDEQHSMTTRVYDKKGQRPEMNTPDIFF